MHTEYCATKQVQAVEWIPTEVISQAELKTSALSASNTILRDIHKELVMKKLWEMYQNEEWLQLGYGPRHNSAFNIATSYL